MAQERRKEEVCCAKALRPEQLGCLDLGPGNEETGMSGGGGVAGALEASRASGIFAQWVGRSLHSLGGWSPGLRGGREGPPGHLPHPAPGGTSLS